MESKRLFAIRRLVAREATWGARKGSREIALREADEQRTDVRNYAIIQLANGRCPPSPYGEIGGDPMRAFTQLLLALAIVMALAIALMVLLFF